MHKNNRRITSNLRGKAVGLVNIQERCRQNNPSKVGQTEKRKRVARNTVQFVDNEPIRASLFVRIISRLPAARPARAPFEKASGRTCARARKARAFAWPGLSMHQRARVARVVIESVGQVTLVRRGASIVESGDTRRSVPSDR